ncbi:MAG: NAD(P)H-dependent oxidoreductase [Cardiobacteriaceae bacterium]|nr:NAD(P)H-dependent oxidoreductase [Cardiobacteriaceae bacterium]
MQRRKFFQYSVLSATLLAGINKLFASDKNKEIIANAKSTQNIYIINGANSKEVWGAKGKLNDSLCQIAKEELEKLGKKVTVSKIADGYDIQKESDKIINADAIIWQMPVWFMAQPWFVKKYIDEVFMEVMMKTNSNDGRHRTNPDKDYGRGGKLTTLYMLSTTWNAPAAAFTQAGEFFDGKGIDGAFYQFHKGTEFLGMKPLPSFMCNDVIKNPQIEKDFVRYRKHLQQVFA